MVKIGLFGGSFDPIHNGHILLAEKAIKQLKLNQIVFVPAYSPPHKSRKMTSAFHRKKMLRLAIAGRKKFTISDFELKLKKKVYTYQTLEYFRKKYPGAEFYLIIGSDSAKELVNWRRFEKLVRHNKIVVGRRESYNFYKKRYFTELSGKIKNISSTVVRSRIRNGFALKGLVPFNVEKYIKRNGLYPAL
ncbi:MAG: nicotinate (nicotinamide) nucleotide adenylyltransferase [Elusimicrobia bacterium]|nr:nicotinate (nicotinamide) nucleotide adenylyltransferase [Elusimicrobiota bacterium]